MAVASGIASAVGFGKETTWNTPVAVNHWLPHMSESLEANVGITEFAGLQFGRMYELGVWRAATSSDGSGQVTFPVTFKQFGLLIAQAFGSTAAPVQVAATTAYLQTHVPNSQGQTGFGTTIQKQLPDASGTMTPFTFAGCKITALTLAIDTGGWLTCAVTVDAGSVTQGGAGANALQTPSYTAGNNQYHWGLANVFTLGGTAATTSGVTAITGGTAPGIARSLSVAFAFGQKTDDYRLGNPGTKAEPRVNARPTITGSIGAGFYDTAELYANYVAQIPMPLRLRFTGPIIAAANPYFFDLILPQVFLNGDTPKAGGPDVIDIAADFKATEDGANPAAQVQIQSTDVTL